MNLETGISILSWRWTLWTFINIHCIISIGSSLSSKLGIHLAWAASEQLILHLLLQEQHLMIFINTEVQQQDHHLWSICSFFVFMSAFRTNGFEHINDSIVSKLVKSLFCNLCDWDIIFHFQSHSWDLATHLKIEQSVQLSSRNLPYCVFGKTKSVIQNSQSWLRALKG